MSSPISGPTFSDLDNVKLETPPVMEKLAPAMILQMMATYAAQIQNACPTLSCGRVFAQVRERADLGQFGDISDLRALFNPTHHVTRGHSSNIGRASSQFCLSGYPHHQMPYSQQQVLPLLQHAHAGTVNPSTLMFMDTTAQYFNPELDFNERDSNITQADVEFDSPYGYVSYLGVLPDLTVKDISISGQPSLTYTSYRGM